MDNPIVGLFNESGMSIREFATQSDLKYSTAHDIVTGKTDIEKIGAGAFVRIAATLGTSADELMGLYLDRVSSLPPDERELLNLFRNMDGQGRAHVMETARMCAALTVKDGRGIRPDVAVAGIAVER